MIRRMHLRGLTAAICTVSFGMAAIAFSRASQWHINFGDVGTWLSGIGTFAAAVVALKIAGDETRRYNDEKATSATESREQATRRAKRIIFNTGAGSLEPDYTVRVVTLQNAGNSPIYDLTWYPPVIVAQRSPTLTEVFRKVEIDGEPPKPTFLNPDNIWRVQYRHKSVPKLVQSPSQYPDEKVATTTALPVISFEDDDGNRFGLTVDEVQPTRRGGHPSWEQRWTLVNDDYPALADGVLGKLLKQAATDNS